jgi:hypothetical protein
MRGNPKRIDPPRQANDLAVAKRLWDVSEQLSGLKFV